jgi:UDP-glucose 4-epimerase
MDLRNKSVLVTGGAGFVGSHIVDQLLLEGCANIVALDNMVRGRPENLASAMEDRRVELVVGDIRDHGLLAELVAESDAIFHQAALRITHCAAEPRLAIEVMVHATYDLLELCVEHKIEKLIAASSASVYGEADSFPITETHHPYNNRTIYGAAKLFNEGLLRSFSDMYGLNYVALRYFNVYGTRMDLHGKYTEVLIRWIQRMAAGEPPLIFGTGSQTMDFLDVRDVARANMLAMKADVTDEAFNIASGCETSLLQLANMLASAMGRPDLAPQFREERNVNRVTRRLADTRRAKQRLGFRTIIPLEQGLADLIAWWRNESSERFLDANKLELSSAIR